MRGVWGKQRRNWIPHWRTCLRTTETPCSLFILLFFRAARRKRASAKTNKTSMKNELALGSHENKKQIHTAKNVAVSSYCLAWAEVGSVSFSCWFSPSHFDTADTHRFIYVYTGPCIRNVAKFNTTYKVGWWLFRRSIGSRYHFACVCVLCVCFVVEEFHPSHSISLVLAWNYQRIVYLELRMVLYTLWWSGLRNYVTREMRLHSPHTHK